MATEGTIQSAVFQIELGRGKRVLQWMLVVLLAVALSLVYSAGQFRGLEKREAMDMAQLGRNLAHGQGFTTYCIRPLSLWHQKTLGPAHDPQLMSHPDLYNPPLYPLVLAGAFKLFPATIFDLKVGDHQFPAERWVILPLNQLLLLASVLLVYFWAKQIFDRRIAIMAGLLLLVSDTLWSFGVSGLPTNLLMFLLLLSIFCLSLVDRRLNPPELADTDPAAPTPQGLTGVELGLVIASAVLLGLCFLTRYLAAFLVLPMALYVAAILRGRRGVLWAVVYAAVFVVVIAPWLVRNYHLSNSLLGIAKYELIDRSGAFGGDSLWRSYKPDLQNVYSVHTLTSKFLTGARAQLTGSFRNVGSDFLVFFFGVGLMYGFRRGDTIRLRGLLVGCLVCAMFGMALIGSPAESYRPDVNGGNLLVLFLPLIAIYGAAFFYLLLDRIAFRIRLTRGIAIGVFVLLNVAPMIFTLLPPRRGPFPYPPYAPPYTQVVADFYTEKEFGVSDMPWAMAWDGNRRTVWLPMFVDEFTELNDWVATAPGFSFMFLTAYMLDKRFQSDLHFGEYKDWLPILSGRNPDRFPLKAVTAIPPQGQQYLLSDHVRWAPEPETSSTEPATGTNAPPAAAKSSK